MNVQTDYMHVLLAADMRSTNVDGSCCCAGHVPGS